MVIPELLDETGPLPQYTSRNLPVVDDAIYEEAVSLFLQQYTPGQKVDGDVLLRLNTSWTLQADTFEDAEVLAEKGFLDVASQSLAAGLEYYDYPWLVQQRAMHLAIGALLPLALQTRKNIPLRSNKRITAEYGLPKISDTVTFYFERIKPPQLLEHTSAVRTRLPTENPRLDQFYTLYKAHMLVHCLEIGVDEAELAPIEHLTDHFFHSFLAAFEYAAREMPRNGRF